MPAFKVVRSIEIDADIARVFKAVSDFGTWTIWSPWLIAEPEAKVTVSSDGKSVGAVYAWNGNVTGQGEIEHLQLVPNSLIDDEIRFQKPFRSQGKVGFRLEPKGSATKLSWSMDSHLPWFMFFMVPFFKTFIGMDYMRGLRMLKDWIETGSIPSKVIQHGIENTGGFQMAGVASSCDVEAVGESMETALVKATELFKASGLPLSGPMISVYTRFHVRKGVFDYISGFIVPDNVKIPSSAGLKVWSISPTKSLRVEHIGSYRHLGNAWSVANQIARHRRLKQQRSGTWEIYRTTPPSTPDAELRTDIYLPLR